MATYSKHLDQTTLACHPTMTWNHHRWCGLILQQSDGSHDKP